MPTEVRKIYNTGEDVLIKDDRFTFSDGIIDGHENILLSDGIRITDRPTITIVVVKEGIIYPGSGVNVATVDNGYDNTAFYSKGRVSFSILDKDGEEVTINGLKNHDNGNIMEIKVRRISKTEKIA